MTWRATARSRRRRRSQLAVDDGKGNKLRPFPAGLAVSADNAKLFVADDFDNTLSIFDLATSKETRVALSAAQCVIGDWGDVSEGENCEFPYTVALSADGKSAYVSDWGQKTVDVVDVASAKLTLEDHRRHTPECTRAEPEGRPPVRCQHRTVTMSLRSIRRPTHVTRTISLAPYRDAPVGTNPEALSVSSDGSRLYVANAGDNDVAVVDLGSPKGRGEGTDPDRLVSRAGVHVASDGKHLLVLNAKGLGAGPNAAGPNPTKDPESGPDQYIGSMIQGSLSVIATPQGKDLRTYTDQVRHNDGFDRGASSTHVRRAPARRARAARRSLADQARDRDGQREPHL